MTKLVLALLACSTIAHSQTANPPVAVTTTATFTSGGKSIQVDVTRSVLAGVRPSVIFLYGSDAMALAPWDYPTIANWFASQGYNFFIIHYFNRTGTVLATPLVVYQAFGSWIQTVSDATTWVGSQPGVDPYRIALMGMSLGTSLAISEASRDPRIKTLAAWYGGEATWYEYTVKNTITRLPPTVIIHGSNDPISPVADAYALQALLQSLSVPNVMKVYPNEGHAFGPADQTDALNLTLAFFQQYL